MVLNHVWIMMEWWNPFWIRWNLSATFTVSGHSCRGCDGHYHQPLGAASLAPHIVCLSLHECRCANEHPSLSTLTRAGVSERESWDGDLWALASGVSCEDFLWWLGIVSLGIEYCQLKLFKKIVSFNDSVLICYFYRMC